ncbi:hypothetical protein ACIBQX_20760 [Nonomuraea sp. NPDC049714]|uniref:hypothetical protein n=1 Tax=Nonomuraea sp. NPDC049714 TaxID=3364357 RepID=UPI0037B29D25
MPPPPPPPADNSTGVTVAMVFAGVGVYSAVNTVLGFFIFFAALSQSNSSGTGGATAFLVVGAVVLVLVGLVAGVGLLFVRKPWATGMGLGLMIGWALWSITTAGFCTGINPGLYG